MIDQTTTTASDAEPLDALSARVSKALEEDVRRRRWVTRVFVVLALIPVIAAGMVLSFGHSEVEQTAMIVQRHTEDIETKVAQQVSESVANELAGARKVAALLPELKSAVEVAPLVHQQQRALAEYRTTVDSALARQQQLSESVEDATRSLAKIPAELGNLVSQVETASRRADSAQSQASAALASINTTAKALEARVTQTEGQVARVAGVEKTIASVQSETRKARAQMETQLQKTSDHLARVSRIEKSIAAVQSESRKTNADLVRKVDQRIKRLSVAAADPQRLRDIDKRLSSLSRQSARLKALETQIAKLPGQPTDLRKLQRSVQSLSGQMKKLSSRLGALERRASGGGSADVSKQMRTLQSTVGKMNRSLSSRLSRIDKRLQTLERSRGRVIK